MAGSGARGTQALNIGVVYARHRTNLTGNVFTFAYTGIEYNMNDTVFQVVVSFDHWHKVVEF